MSCSKSRASACAGSRISFEKCGGWAPRASMCRSWWRATAALCSSSCDRPTEATISRSRLCSEARGARRSYGARVAAIALPAAGLSTRDGGLVIPASAHRLGEIDHREAHVAGGKNLQRLRLQELPLGVEHLEIGRITRPVTRVREVEGMPQLLRSLGFGRERLAHRLVR